MRLLLSLSVVSLLIGVIWHGAAGAGPLDMTGAPQALVCSACHGFAGHSRSNTIPIIAGMAPWYFKKAIQDYASGKRTSPEMEPYAKMVLQSGVDDIASYFAAQADAVSGGARFQGGRARAGRRRAVHGLSRDVGQGRCVQGRTRDRGPAAGLPAESDAP